MGIVGLCPSSSSRWAPRIGSNSLPWMRILSSRYIPLKMTAASNCFHGFGYNIYHTWHGDILYTRKLGKPTIFQVTITKSDVLSTDDGERLVPGENQDRLFQGKTHWYWSQSVSFLRNGVIAWGGMLQWDSFVRTQYALLFKIQITTLFSPGPPVINYQIPHPFSPSNPSIKTTSNPFIHLVDFQLSLLPKLTFPNFSASQVESPPNSSWRKEAWWCRVIQGFEGLLIWE